MPRFRKRPLEVEAEQFLAAFVFDGKCWEHIHTSYQHVETDAGDWIVSEPEDGGRFYPIKNGGLSSDIQED